MVLGSTDVGSGADASQLHAAILDVKEIATQEPSSQRHRDAPPEESKASQPNQQGGGSDCFDATQYAFFGGNVSTEVELGGLDDEDDGAFDAPEDDEDGEALEGDMPLVSRPHSLKHAGLRYILHNSWYVLQVMPSLSSNLRLLDEIYVLLTLRRDAGVVTQPQPAFGASNSASTIDALTSDLKKVSTFGHVVSIVPSFHFL